MAELLFFRAGELQMCAPIRGPRMVLGRSNDADFVLPDRAVSRLQCEVVERPGGWALVDLSGRGTPVSQRLAGENGTPLRDGDEVKLGEYAVVFGAANRPAVEPERTRSKLRGMTRTVSLKSRKDDGRPRARIIRTAPDGDLSLPLRAEEGWKLVIGTKPEGSARLELSDSFVSAEHVRIQYRGGRWTITDLKSRNGTYVDGVRIVEAVLGPRSAIRLGETTLHFEEDASRAQASDEATPGLVSRDAAMQPVIEQLRRIAPSKVPVAIHGETGTGKEVFASALHQLSERRDRPFLAINCGALPAELIESELFGHEKGAFTGADRTRAGAFEEAHGGTLFLDEVGELPLAAQVKLLRALETGEVRRLGATKTISVDVRIVCATHRDLFAAVEDGSFREDLYYRLCVALLELPPLRQRIADILPLAEHFAAKISPAGTKVSFSPSAKAKLEGHPWPGNARELRNVVQLALLQRRGPLVTDDDVTLREPTRRPRTLDTMRVAGRTLDEIEREAFRLALERHGGDRRAAMEELGVPRSTFFRKIEQFGLGRPA